MLSIPTFSASALRGHTLLVLLSVFASPLVSSGASLPSWNDTAAKQKIVEFVEATTTEDSPDFVPPAERIAVFDNDGTLWSEQPMYFQLFFIFDRINKLAPQNPDWKTTEPFASVLKGDYAKALSGGDKAIMELVTASSSGMTGDEYAAEVGEWIKSAKHPETKMLFTEMVFQPMLELMDYLRGAGYKVFIVSGGGVDFMRPFTEKVYGVPAEQVVGSELKAKFAMKNGIPVIEKLPSLDFIDDKTGKPMGIYQHIGRRPVFAAGNSDGDLEMLQYTTIPRGSDDDSPRFGLLVHHDDAEREWAYDRKSHFGTLDKALDAASGYGWLVVSMKDDWKTIYPSGSDK